MKLSYAQWARDEQHSRLFLAHCVMWRNHPSSILIIINDIKDILNILNDLLNRT